MGERLISHPGVTCIESLTSGSLPPPPPMSLQSVTRKKDLFTQGGAWWGEHVDICSCPWSFALILRRCGEGGERQSWCIWVRELVWYLAQSGGPQGIPWPLQYSLSDHLQDQFANPQNRASNITREFPEHLRPARLGLKVEEDTVHGFKELSPPHLSMEGLEV